MSSSEYTLLEIMSQDKALEETFKSMTENPLRRAEKPVIHVFTGCGTSFYLAHAAAKYFQKITGEVALSVPASELFMNEKTVISSQFSYIIVAISRSGTTSEVLKALNHLSNLANCSVLAVTCNENSEMINKSEQSIVLKFINEKSVVMTQSFSSMLYALQLYAALWASNSSALESLKAVPLIAKAVLKKKEDIKMIVENSKAKRFVFLGADVFNGLAKEATLKLKEMTQIECESYSNLEFRHGPISTVDNRTAVILLSSDSSVSYDQSLVTDIQSKGGSVIVLVKQGTSIKGDVKFEIPSYIGSEESASAFMPFLQLFAYYKAIELNLNPDEPRNLTQVVEISI